MEQQEPYRLPDGYLLDNRYTVVCRISEGGSGHVYEVHDPLLDRRCAVKVYHGSITTHSRDFFEKEGRTLAALSHPHIVPVYDAGTLPDSGRPYLVTAFVEGQPLSEYVAPETLLPLRRAIDLIVGLLDVLATIHPDGERIAALEAAGREGALTGQEFEEFGRLRQAGWYHRDIKPSNLMLRPDGSVVLIDFNIAARAARAHLTPSGTPPYMLPDAAFVPAGPDADLFATGVVLYELVTGHHPYVQGIPNAAEMPTDPRSYLPDLHPLLADLLLRAVSIDAGRRYHSARRFRDDVLRLASLTGPAQAQSAPRQCAHCGAAFHATTATFCHDCGEPVEGQDVRTGMHQAILHRARAAAADGHMTEAFNLVMGPIHRAQDAHLPDVAASLLAELRAIVPEETLSRSDRAWLLNANGLALSALGRRVPAWQAFEVMDRLGAELGDLQIRATAHQNLGVLAQQAKDFTAARDHYASSIEASLAAGDYERATQVLVNEGSLEMDAGNVEAAVGLLGRAAHLIDAGRLLALGPALDSNLALLAVRLGRLAEAERLFARAYRIARAQGNRPGELRTLHSLGQVALDTGRPTLAIRRFCTGLARVTTGLYPDITHKLLQGFARALDRAGRRAEAVLPLEEARQLAATLDDTHAWAEDTANLGLVLGTTGDTARGLALLTRAVLFFREAGSAWQVHSLGQLASVQEAAGQPGSAVASLEEAFASAPGGTSDERRDRAKLLEQAAWIWLRTPGNADRAAPLFERNLRELEALLTQAAYAVTVVKMGAALSQHGAPLVALPFLEKATSLFEGLGDLEAVCRTRIEYGMALKRLGRDADACDSFKEARAQATTLQNQDLLLTALLDLSETLRQQHLAAEALVAAREMVAVARGVSEQALCGALCTLAMVERDAGERSAAVARFVSVKAEARRLRLPEVEAHAARGLATDGFSARRYASAARLYHRAERLWARTDDAQHRAEALAGAMESLSAAGHAEAMATTAQRLVDLAQGTNLVQLASLAFARSARWWLTRDQDEQALDLYSDALAVAATWRWDEEHPLREDDQEPADDATDPRLKALFRATMSVLIGIHDNRPDDTDNMLAAVRGRLEARAPQLGELFGMLLEHALPVVLRIGEPARSAAASDQTRPA